jgi:peptidoglycan-N-acetylglucosamine deacetylase
MGFRIFGFFLLVLSANSALAANCTESSFLSRVVAIDSSNGAVYGSPGNNTGDRSPPSPLELRDKEVVLTFDQGPHPVYTKYILDILDQHCAKAVFFFTGSAASANPSDVADAARRGHTIGAGSWSAAVNFAKFSTQDAQTEIEKSFAAAAKGAGTPIAPFFRGGAADLSPDTLSYLKERGVSLWSYDITAGDTEPGLTATQLANRALLKIREKGKGVIQFHDTRKVTVDALDSILGGLRLSGFKVVQIVPASEFSPKTEYLASVAVPAPRERTASRTSRKLIDSAKHQARIKTPERTESPRRIRRSENTE